MDELTQNAVHDSPVFRMRLRTMADAHFEEVVKQQELAIKMIRQLVEDGAKQAELMPKVAEQVRSVMSTQENFFSVGNNDTDLVEDDGQVAVCNGNVLQNIIMADYQVRSGMCRQAANRLLRDLLTFRQAEVDRVRELRRAYERALDRYEASLTRHAVSLKKSLGGDPKAKSISEPTDNDLVAIRRQYYQAMAELMEQLVNYKVRTSKFWTEKAASFVDIMGEAEALLEKIYSHQEFKGDGSTSDTLEQNIFNDPQGFKKSLMQAVEQEFDFSVAMQKRLLEKHGHLFRKKTRGIGPPWRLVYVSIEKQLFKLWAANIAPSAPNTATAANSASDDPQALEVNILLCQIKLYESVERACCFEVSTPQRSFIFQAISEDDLMDWLRVFENAKNSAINTPLSPTKTAQSQLQKIETVEGVPESLKRISEHHNLPLIFAYDHVLFDGHCGSLMGTMEAIYGGDKIVNVKWVEVDRFDLSTSSTQKVLSTTLTLHLRNRQVDSPQGRIIEVLFLDTKQHSQQAQQFAELARLLSGPRKSVSTVEEIVDLLYNKNSSDADAINANDETQQQLLSSYPSDFEAPTPKQMEELFKQFVFSYQQDLDSQELDFTAHLPASVLFETLYQDPEGALFKVLHERLGNTNFSISYKVKEEETENENEFKTTMSYMHPLNNPIIKAKETQCIEKMTIKVIKPHILYMIDVTASTPDILYGDAFSTRSRFVISFKTRSSCRIQAWFGMHWTRSVLVRSIIKATAKSGFADYANAFKQVVREEVARRTKRPVGLQTGQDENSLSGESVGSVSGDRIGGRRGTDYTVYIAVLCVMLVFGIFIVHHLIGHAHDHPEYGIRMIMPGFKPPLLTIDAIINQARLAEQALLESKYVEYLYTYLKTNCGSGNNKNGEYCERALGEWKRITRARTP